MATLIYRTLIEFPARPTVPGPHGVSRDVRQGSLVAFCSAVLTPVVVVFAIAVAKSSKHLIGSTQSIDAARGDLSRIVRGYLYVRTARFVSFTTACAKNTTNMLGHVLTCDFRQGPSTLRQSCSRGGHAPRVESPAITWARAAWGLWAGDGARGWDCGRFVWPRGIRPDMDGDRGGSRFQRCTAPSRCKTIRRCMRCCWE